MSTNTTTAERRLRELGIVLPPAPTPLGAYVEAVQTGNLLFLSGTLPVVGGVPKFLGRIGGELSVEDGRHATRLVFGMASLPVGVCVVPESIFEVSKLGGP